MAVGMFSSLPCTDLEGGRPVTVSDRFLIGMLLQSPYKAVIAHACGMMD